jgi:1-deoxy-D-xylulose-5-phosphate synthase
MLSYAVQYDAGPVFIRYPRGNAIAGDQAYPALETGKSFIVQAGKDIAVLGVGKALQDARELVQLIKTKYSLDAILIDARFVKPLDIDLLSQLSSRIKVMITIEDNSLQGGMGESIKSFYCNSAVQVFSFGIPDSFVTHGKVSLLKKELNLEAGQILQKLEEESIFPRGIL